MKTCIHGGETGSVIAFSLVVMLAIGFLFLGWVCLLGKKSRKVESEKNALEKMIKTNLEVNCETY